MFRIAKLKSMINIRTFKNFGHKRQPIPAVTTVWHGFLTFTFIGLAIEWKKITKFIFGEDPKGDAPWESSPDLGIK